ncbi:gamma-aminobutyraldehyde dehydrogenase, partial [Microbacterium esteraromaticum]
MQFIDGARRSGTGGEDHTVVDPSTGRPIVDYEVAGTQDVEDAMRAAKNAAGAWGEATPAERAGVLISAGRMLTERADEFAAIESRNAGK